MLSAGRSIFRIPACVACLVSTQNDVRNLLSWLFQSGASIWLCGKNLIWWRLGWLVWDREWPRSTNSWDIRAPEHIVFDQHLFEHVKGRKGIVYAQWRDAKDAKAWSFVNIGVLRGNVIPIRGELWPLYVIVCALLRFSTKQSCSNFCDSQSRNSHFDA